MSGHDVRGMGYHNSPHLMTMGDIAEEVMRARDKFPGNRFLIAAAIEEMGELGEAIGARAGQDTIRREATQVACLMIRIIEDADPAVYEHSDLVGAMVALGETARGLLQRNRELTVASAQALTLFGAAMFKSGASEPFSDVTDEEAKP